MSLFISVEISLTAAIVGILESEQEKFEPMIFVGSSSGSLTEKSLPSGPFNPLIHRTFEIGLRAWVSEQAQMNLGYVEQLYTFGDRGRDIRQTEATSHHVSVGYLALVHIQPASRTTPPIKEFQPWYDFFPWEDWRYGRPPLLNEVILPRLRTWCHETPEISAFLPSSGMSRQERIAFLFETETSQGYRDDERVLERYECLYEAGLIAEAWRDRGEDWTSLPLIGRSMPSDHRRILATAMGRLRGKIKYRPVIFELMPENFTLTRLQSTVEAISGRHLHKQNFRRLVETLSIVEPTGDISYQTRGRPAHLFRFRREVLQERPSSGLRLNSRK